jgi:hypothetical protein
VARRGVTCFSFLRKEKYQKKSAYFFENKRTSKYNGSPFVFFFVRRKEAKEEHFFDRLFMHFFGAILILMNKQTGGAP